VESYQRALAACPIYAAAFTNMGNALRLLGELDQAAAAHQRALELMPQNATILYNLGLVYQDQWKIDAAIECFRRALAINPGYVAALSNLGTALEKSGRRLEAIAAFERVVALDPNNAGAQCNLGGLLLSGSRIDEALAHSRRAIELNGNLAEAHANYANALWQAGRTDLAIHSFWRAAELAPHNKGFLSNCSFAAYFDAGSTLADLKRTHELWNQRFAEPLRSSIQPHHNDRTPGRRLRVGYVSPNFQAHAEAAFIVPLLENHDRSEVESYCYSDVARPDGVTERLKQRADVWRQTVGVSDADLADAIRADRIDILIDLSMHMSGSRLPVFARKPAPIQIAYLAYPGTTGLPTMDYRLTDSFVDPPGMFENHYTEKCIRLPRTFACYNPAALEDSDLTRIGAGFVRSGSPPTFGSLNNFAKVNDGVLKLWSGVLRAVSGSRLRLLAGAEEGRRHVLDRLGKLGVEPNRIDFVGKQQRPEYLKEYLRIDICLDTLPYCGHTTTLDALWMGVPVVTRVGATAAGRVGWSLMNNLQLTDLAGHDDEEFVRIAAGLAADAPRRRQLHATLRQRLTDSPLMDGGEFARDVEAAYRRVWHDWISR